MTTSSSVDRPGLYEIEILGLSDSHIYPAGDALSAEFFKTERFPLLDRSTPVASIGSCFAREIKTFLIERGYHYLQTSDSPHARHGSAAWDRVYNTFCLRQEFERALGTFTPADTYWVRDGRLLDPYRKNVTWASEKERREELATHQRDARCALTEADVLIVTVGLNEIWYSTEDGSVYFQVPPAEAFDPARHAFRTATVDENVANLERMYALVKEANPECAIIMTVSPVPLRASFRKEHNAVISNAESKAVLLVATKQFAAAHDDVHYFPSYELVMHAIADPFEQDNRHVKRGTVAQIMDVFEYTFSRESGDCRASAAPVSRKRTNILGRIFKAA